MAENINLGEMYVKVRADLDALTKEINGLKRKMEKDADDIGNTFGNKLKKAFQTVGAVLAFKQVLDFGIQAKNAARDASEIRSKFDTVFESLKTQANELADNFAKNFGVAGTTARELLSSTGDLLVGFGFTEKQALELANSVNSLAQDLTSFTNYAGGAKGASDALTKALLGETEMAKGLGIVIRQNSDEFMAEVKSLMRSKNMTETQAKALAVLKEAYKQSGKAVGDYERTKDSLANTERRLSEQFKEVTEQIGNGLVPPLKILIELFNNLSTNVGDSTNSLSAFGAVMRTLGVVSIIVFTTLKQIGNMLGTLAAGFTKFSLIGAIFSGQNPLTGAFETFKAGSKIMDKDSQSMIDALNKMFNTNEEKTKDTKFPEGSPGAINKQLTEIRKRNELLKVGSDEYKKNLKEIERLEGLLGFGGGGGNNNNGKIDKLNEDYYNKVKFKDSSYYEYRLGLLNNEAKEWAKLGKDKVAIEQYVNEEILKLNKERADYWRANEKMDQVNTDPYFANKTYKSPISEIDISTAKDKSEELNKIRLEKDLEYYETRRQLAEDAQITESEMLIAGYQSMTAGIEDAFRGFWDGIRLSEEQSRNAIIRGFTTMANAFIAEVQRMAAQWLAFQALSGILGIFGGGGVGAAVAKAARGHNGGSFLGTSNGIVKLASGGSFVVPSGFPNDSYPMLVESGERVTVTPANQTRQQDNALLGELRNVKTAIQALNLNVVSGNNPMPKNIELESTLQGNDIYMSNKKTTKKISRYS